MKKDCLEKDFKAFGYKMYNMGKKMEEINIILPVYSNYLCLFDKNKIRIIEGEERFSFYFHYIELNKLKIILSLMSLY